MMVSNFRNENMKSVLKQITTVLRKFEPLVDRIELTTSKTLFSFHEKNLAIVFSLFSSVAAWIVNHVCTKYKIFKCEHTDITFHLYIEIHLRNHPIILQSHKFTIHLITHLHTKAHNVTMTLNGIKSVSQNCSKPNHWNAAKPAETRTHPTTRLYLPLDERYNRKCFSNKPIYNKLFSKQSHAQAQGTLTPSYHTTPHEPPIRLLK